MWAEAALAYGDGIKAADLHATSGSVAGDGGEVAFDVDVGVVGDVEDDLMIVPPVNWNLGWVRASSSIRVRDDFCTWLRGARKGSRLY